MPADEAYGYFYANAGIAQDIQQREGYASTFLNAGIRAPRRITDSFNRSDRNPPGVSDSGHLWVDRVGDWAIRSNQLACLNSTGTIIALATLDAGFADIDFSGDLTVIPADDGYAIGLLFRYTDSSNWWRYIIGRTGDLYLQKNVAGSISNAATPINVGTVACTLRVVAQGNTITTYRNGVQQFQIVDSHNRTATLHGSSISIGAGGGDAGRLDNFSMTEVISGADEGYGFTYLNTTALIHTQQREGYGYTYLNVPEGRWSIGYILIGV